MVPQRPGQDPVHYPLRASQVRRARWHGLVDVVEGRDNIREDDTEDGHVGRAQVVMRSLDLRQASFRLGYLRGQVFAHHQGYAGEHAAPRLQRERAQGRGQSPRGVVQPALAQD